MTDTQAETASQEGPSNGEWAARVAARVNQPREVRVVDAELTPPSANQGLMEVFRRRYLLRLLVQRELRGRYEGSFLGFLWSYINPLSQFFIYWFVMGKIMKMHDSVPNFPVHIFAAMIVAHFFTETFGAGTRSLVTNKGLLKKMAMPREMFPVAAMLVSFFHVVPQLVILFAVCALSGWTPEPKDAIALTLAILLCMMLGTSLALLFSCANVFFRDFGSFVGILNHFVRFGIPMIYSYQYVASLLGPTGQQIYLANPIAQSVLLMQQAFWIPTLSEGQLDASLPGQPHQPQVVMPAHLIERGLLTLLACLVLLAFSQWVFNKLEKRVPERL